MVVKTVLPNDRYVLTDMEKSHSRTSKKGNYERVIAVDRMPPWRVPGRVSDDIDNESGESEIVPSDEDTDMTDNPPLTLEAIMGAMKTLLAPINERLQRLEEAVFSDKASEAGSTSTITGFSEHSLKSGESDLMETEGFSPVKTGKKRPAPSRSPQSIETQNKFLSLSEEEEDSEAPLDAKAPLQREKRKKKKKSSSSSKQSFTQAAPSWSAIAAGHPPGSPKCPILAAPQPLRTPPRQPHRAPPRQPLRAPPRQPPRVPLWQPPMPHGFPPFFCEMQENDTWFPKRPTSPRRGASFTRFMEAERIPFHTFTLPEEKTTRVVLRGIPVQVSTDEVFADLKRQGFNPISTHRMHTRKRQLSLVLLEAPLDQAKEVWKMKTVCSLMVKVEKPKKSGKAAQCHRCQRFFHAQRNCTADTNVSSAGKHMTQRCARRSARSLQVRQL
ncbi:hypothetical protein TcasGA2_TC034749 [Tribolium castaneum]|uniref:Pre-C2HC domain-containing protein n=1 Tax=Tribolium castaneum TaxID=7070 RepID=A0A139WG21_TRICA|nr:hypothetical protein TcasGA2_TC034749 [Tribolium castaneum]